jgi:hypothetical protein
VRPADILVRCTKRINGLKIPWAHRQNVYVPLMSAPVLETKSLRLVPHAPEHLRALIKGLEFYARISGLTPANGL